MLHLAAKERPGPELNSAYRRRQDSSYLSVEEQFPLSFQVQRRSISPTRRSLSPTRRSYSPNRTPALPPSPQMSFQYRSQSPLSMYSGKADVTSVPEVEESKIHLLKKPPASISSTGINSTN